jgi:hypothetical protein
MYTIWMAVVHFELQTLQRHWCKNERCHITITWILFAEEYLCRMFFLLFTFSPQLTLKQREWIYNNRTTLQPVITYRLDYLNQVQTTSGVHPASYPMGIVGCPPKENWPLTTI